MSKYDIIIIGSGLGSGMRSHLEQRGLPRLCAGEE